MRIVCRGSLRSCSGSCTLALRSTLLCFSAACKAILQFQSQGSIAQRNKSTKSSISGRRNSAEAQDPHQGHFYIPIGLASRSQLKLEQAVIRKEIYQNPVTPIAHLMLETFCPTVRGRQGYSLQGCPYTAQASTGFHRL